METKNRTQKDTPVLPPGAVGQVIRGEIPQWIRDEVVKRLVGYLKSDLVRRGRCEDVYLDYNVVSANKEIRPYGLICVSGKKLRRLKTFKTYDDMLKWLIFRAWERMNGYRWYECSLEWIPWHYPRWPLRLVCRNTDLGGYKKEDEFYEGALRELIRNI